MHHGSLHGLEHFHAADSSHVIDAGDSFVDPREFAHFLAGSLAVDTAQEHGQCLRALDYLILHSLRHGNFLHLDMLHLDNMQIHTKNRRLQRLPIV